MQCHKPACRRGKSDYRWTALEIGRAASVGRRAQIEIEIWKHTRGMDRGGTLENGGVGLGAEIGVWE